MIEIDNDTNTAAQTKNVEINLNFKSGETATVLAPVNKSKYTSLQSKSCTYRQNLIAQVSMGKISKQTARENWNKNVVNTWDSIVRPGYESSFPKTITDQVASIRPACNLLDFDLSAVHGKDVVEEEANGEAPEAEVADVQ